MFKSKHLQDLQSKTYQQDIYQLPNDKVWSFITSFLSLKYFTFLTHLICCLALDHLVIKPFDLLMFIPWTMVAYLWQNSCQFFFSCIVFVHSCIFRNICIWELYTYENYMHVRNICVLEIHACQKYMHVNNICMSIIYACQ